MSNTSYSFNMSRVVDLIEKKRDGKFLTREDLELFIQNTINGGASESQIGAMLMAMYLQGLTDTETLNLTRAIINSGSTMQWDPEWISKGLLADKHSTGGVGDKISIVLAPAMAACGLKVPMISGRGLAHTGGTLDKLESIPGYRCTLDHETMWKALKEAGCFIAAASESIAPGDKYLYRIRDVTATISSNPLIVASIISKKVAEGTRALVIDIKVGTAAFLKDIESARILAEMLIVVSKKLGVKTHVTLSKMFNPIGRAVGNALEIAECIELMQGRGPADIRELVMIQGGLLLQMQGHAQSQEEGEAMIGNSLDTGTALKSFRKMLVCQGVSEKSAEELCRNPWNVMEKVPDTQITKLNLPKSGYVKSIDAMAIGEATWRMGAGRSRPQDSIDQRVGIQLLLTVGDQGQKGDPWIEVYNSEPTLSEYILKILEGAITIQSEPVSNESLLIEVI